MCSDITSLIPDTGNLCFLYFFLDQSNERIINFINLFKEPAFRFIDISLLFFCFPFHWFPLWPLLFPFLYLKFHLLFLFLYLKFETEVIDLQSFFVSIIGYAYLLRVASVGSHKFWSVVCIFSFSSKYFLISLLIPSLIHGLFIYVLFSF